MKAMLKAVMIRVAACLTWRMKLARIREVGMLTRIDQGTLPVAAKALSCSVPSSEGPSTNPRSLLIVS